MSALGQSRHVQRTSSCPLWANSGHCDLTSALNSHIDRIRDRTPGHHAYVSCTVYYARLLVGSMISWAWQGGLNMTDWLYNLPIFWMALVVFGVTYLVAGGIYGLVTALAKGERARAFKAISSGMLPPLGI